MPSLMIAQSMDCYGGKHFEECTLRPRFCGIVICDCLCHHEKKLQKALSKNKVLALVGRHGYTE